MSITLRRDSSLNPRHVIDEMVTTEQSYIKDLTDIIDVSWSAFLRTCCMKIVS